MGLKPRQLYLVSGRPKRYMATGDRRRLWEALRDGVQQSDYDIFAVDNVILPRSANPLRDSSSPHPGPPRGPSPIPPP